MSDGEYMQPWYADLSALAPSELNPQVSDIERGVLLSEPSRRFTSEMLDELRRKKVQSVFVSLAMSFSWNQSKPDMRLSDYKMNAEEFELPAESAEILRTALAERSRIISIGTSCVRVLESVSVPPSAVRSRTNLFISPGFEFRYCDALLTNLHNSMGTHVIMASAFGGRELVIEACRQAVKENYRFGIFGDSMLVFGNRVKAN
jgi:S-adenosylmethionine:tRNA ribosyltransferase-isomerase